MILVTPLAYLTLKNERTRIFHHCREILNLTDFYRQARLKVFLAPLPAALFSMVNTINTLKSDHFELTRGRVNYDAVGKKLGKSSGFPQYHLYLWHNYWAACAAQS